LAVSIELYTVGISITYFQSSFWKCVVVHIKVSSEDSKVTPPMITYSLLIREENTSTYFRIWRTQSSL
jgi:hypothetical protein